MIDSYYSPQTKLRKVVFSQVCVKNSGHREWCAWQGGVHGRGVCLVGGAYVAGGHVWQGVCLAGGTCLAGGMHSGGMDSRGTCMAVRACVVGGMDSRGHAWQGDISWQERWPQQRTYGTHPTGMHSCFLNSICN